MTHRSFRPWSGAVLVLACALAASVASGGERTPSSLRTHGRALGVAPATEGRVMVRFRPGASVLPQRARVMASRYGADGPQAAAVLARRHSIALSDGRMLDERTQVVKALGIDSAALRTQLMADPEVEAVWLDGRRFASATVPNDALYADNGTTATASNPRVEAGQWYLRQPLNGLVSAIDAQGAWQITWGDPSLVVGDIDTGIRAEHPDLQGKVLEGYDMIADAFIANDGGGRDADPTDVGDWVTSADLTHGECTGGTAGDSSWHGTQTAGIIAAATDNGIGMAGTGRDVKVLPVRVLGKCGGYDSDIIAGMRWAAGLDVPGVPINSAHPARVLNLSLGGADATGTGCADFGYDAAIAELASHNVVIVAAAGNESLAVDIPGKCAGVLGVAAIRSVGTKVGFSSLGPEVAISAPGGNCVLTGTNDPCLYPILTTSNTGLTTALASTYTSSFGSISVGTSFSSPQVAGTVALMLSVNPALTNDQVRTMLQSTARPFVTTGGTAGVPVCTAPGTATQDECYCTTSTCGAGMLDARAAVAAAAGQTGASVDVVPSTKTPVVGSSFTLDGTAQLPSAGATIATRAWTIVSGGASAAFTSATDGDTVTLSANAVGPVTVAFTVTDSAGQVGKSIRTMLVQTTAPTATIVAAGGLVSGSDQTYDGSASTATGSNAITGYQWALAAGDTAASIIGSATGPSVTLHGNAAGTVTLTLTVTDSAGATGVAHKSVVVTAPASSGGGGGGGGFGLAACASLLLAIAALRRPRRAKAARRR
jgi:serine protease